MDKIVRTVLAVMGTISEIANFVVCTILGFIWLIYNAIRGGNFKEMFAKFKRDAVKEFKSIIEVIIE